MSKQTQTPVNELEAQVAELTRALNRANRRLQHQKAQLEAGAEINQAASTTFDINQLTGRVAKIIKNRFQLHHVGLYLVDKSGQWLVPAAAAGTASRKLMQAQGRLPVSGPSAIARVTQTQSPFIYPPSTNKKQPAGEVEHHLIPTARSQLVLPLAIHNRVIGALDLQSSHTDAFSPDDTTAWKVLAGQIAAVIERVQFHAHTAAERDRIGLLYKISAALSADLEFDSIASIAVGLADRLGAASGELHLLSDTGELYFKSSYPERNALDKSQWEPLARRTLTEGLDSWVIKTGQSALVVDTQTDSRWLPIGHKDNAPAVRSAICSPIIVERHGLRGAISYVHAEPNHFDEQDLALLQAVASQITVALENSTLLENARKSLDETNLVLQVSRNLSGALTLDDVHVALVSGLMAAGAGRCTVHICNELDVDNVPQVSRVVFVDDSDPKHKTAGLNSQIAVQDYPILYQTARSQEPAVIMDIHTDERLSEEEQALLGRYGTRSLVMIPLIARRHVTGLVTIEFRTPRHINEHQLAVYRTLCNQATIAIENARQVERTAMALAGTQSLYRAGRVLAGAETLSQLLSEALVEFLYSLNLDQGGIVLLSPDRQYGHMVAYVQDYELQDIPQKWFTVDEDIPYQRTLLSGQPFVSQNVPNDPRLADFESVNPDSPPRSLLQVPIILQGETVGWLGADAVQEHRHFTQSEIDLARAMADQVSTAIHNHQLLEQTRRRAEQFRAVAEVGEAVSGLMEMDEVLNKTVNLIRDRFGFYHVSIFLLDEAREWAVVRASTGEVGKIMVERPHRLEVGGQSIVGFATGNATPRIALDVGQDAVHFKNPLLPNTRSEMALPLIARGTVIGALDVQSVEEAAFDDEDVKTLQIMANQLATAIENARLFEQTQRRLIEQAMLYTIGAKISATLNLQEAADDLVVETAHALHVAECALVLVEENKTIYVVSDYVKANGTFPNNQGERHKVEDSAILENILATGAEFAADINNLPPGITGPEIDYLKDHQGTALAIVPVLLRNKVIALLAVYDDTPGRRFSQQDISLLDSIALQAATAIENARLFENARESQTFMKAIIDEIPDPIFIKDRAHKWVVVNRAFADDLLGLPVEEIIGRSDYDYSPREEADWFWQQDEKVFETGQIQETEEPHTSAAGKKRTLYTRKIPLTLNSPDGRPNFLVGIIQDITERKQHEAERERLIRQTQQTLERTQALYRISDVLAAATELRPTFEQVLGEYLPLLNLKQGGVMLLDETSEVNHLHALYIEGQPAEPDLSFPVEQDRVAQHLLKHPEPLVIEDVRTHPLTKDNQELRPSTTRAMLFIPLVIRGKTIGTIAADATDPDYTFTGDDISLGEAIAGQLSIWLENRRLLHEAQHRFTLLQTAATVSGAASTILNADELIETSVNLIRDHFGYYYVGLFLVDPAKEWAVLRAGTGEAGRLQVEKGHRLKIGGESMIGWAVEHRQARIALDVGEEAVHFRNPYLPDTHSEMALPLVSRDEVIGALTVQSVERGAFSDEDITVLQTMADQLANAIANARLFESAQKAARREEIIREISGKIRSSVNVDDIMQTTVVELSKVLGTPRGGITLTVDEPTNER